MQINGVGLRKVSTHKYARYLLFLVALLGSLVLIGWEFDVGAIKRPVPNLVAMNPLTALCFIFLSLATWFKVIYNKYRILGYSLLVLLLSLSAFHLLEFILGIPFNIDQLLFSEKLQVDSISNLSNRMAPNTAINFLLGGIITLFIDSNKKTIFVFQGLAIGIIFISLFSILGYLYQVKEFYGVLVYLPMALHTAFGFLLFALAILILTLDSGIVKEITSPYTGGTISRILIPISIIVPSCLGYLWVFTYWNVGFSIELGVAILTLSIISLFILLTWIMAASLNEKDKLRKTTENEIVHLNKELEAFSYSVAHDLRAPLRIIDGYTQILVEDQLANLNEESQRLLSVISANVRNMGQLIDDLLNFSKLGRVQIRKSSVNVKSIINPIINDQIIVYGKNQFKINIKNTLTLKCDSILIHHVFHNLITNAVKYSAKTKNPIIEIDSYKENDGIVYSVKDNGVGFDMKYANKLFGVFQRLHKPADFEGTGVGLAIVHRIVMKHGGEVWAEAEVDKGATFYFRLPD